MLERILLTAIVTVSAKSKFKSMLAEILASSGDIDQASKADMTSVDNHLPGVSAIAIHGSDRNPAVDDANFNFNYTTAEPAPSSSADSVMSDLISKEDSSAVTSVPYVEDELKFDNNKEVSNQNDQCLTIHESTSLESLLSISTLRPTSLLPSTSLLYPDTAPRSAWRPQIDSWMKKNHPTILKEIVQWSESDKNDKFEKVHPKTAAPLPSASLSTGPSDRVSTGSSPKKERRMSYESKPYARPQKAPEPARPLNTSNAISGPNNGSSSSLPLSSSASQDSSLHAAFHYHSPPRRGSQEDQQSPPGSPGSQDAVISSQFPKRRCISCGSDQSPCWRPSWSAAAGQLCNSCGLRYKKTGARCVSPTCRRIPAKGEWMVMKNAATRIHGKLTFQCLSCGGEVEVGERGQ